MVRWWIVAVLVALGLGIVVGRWALPAPGPTQPAPVAAVQTPAGPVSSAGDKTTSAAHSHGEGPVVNNADSEVDPAEQRCEPTPDCPACNCPEPATCPVCPEPRCPNSEIVCRAHTKIIGELRRDLEASMSDLESCQREGPQGRYKGANARDRRMLAAQDKNLLLEFPSWGEEMTLPPERVEKFQLAPDELETLESIYRAFHTDLHEQLRKLYADLVGDPEAGRDSTINALIHNIMALSPGEHCQERILAILQALAAGGPLPPVTPESAACEQAILLLYSGVDDMENVVAGKLGGRASEALWSGTSSFTYSTASKSDK